MTDTDKNTEISVTMVTKLLHLIKIIVVQRMERLSLIKVIRTSRPPPAQLIDLIATQIGQDKVSANI
jgi:hypothetical protein